MSLGVSVGMCFCVWKYVCAFGSVLVGIRMLECALCLCFGSSSECVFGSASSFGRVSMGMRVGECL